MHERCCIRYQYSLRSLLIACAIVAFVLGYAGSQLSAIWERRQLLNSYANAWRVWQDNSSVPWLRQLFGDRACSDIGELECADGLRSSLSSRISGGHVTFWRDRATRR